jgi:hypothetical protein
MPLPRKHTNLAKDFTRALTWARRRLLFVFLLEDPGSDVIAPEIGGPEIRKRHLRAFMSGLAHEVGEGTRQQPWQGRREAITPRSSRWDVWLHGRSALLDLTQLARAPLAAEAARWIDAIGDAERYINGPRADIASL